MRGTGPRPRLNCQAARRRASRPLPARPRFGPWALRVCGEGPALVGGGRGAGVAQADAPVVARGHQHEREEAAGERLGLVAEALVDAATALLAEEDAAAVLAVVEPVAVGPRGAVAGEG